MSARQPIPAVATVRMNLRSHTSALRDIATLLEATGNAAFTIESLRGLADRAEEMHREQQQADGRALDIAQQRNRLAHEIAERWRLDPSDPVEDLREQVRMLNEADRMLHDADGARGA